MHVAKYKPLKGSSYIDLPRQLKLKKAREVSWSPIKSFMQMAFMMWMSGSGVHIFSIMITFYAVYNPVQSAFTVNSAVARFVRRLSALPVRRGVGGPSQDARHAAKDPVRAQGEGVLLHAPKVTTRMETRNPDAGTCTTPPGIFLAW